MATELIIGKNRYEIVLLTPWDAFELQPRLAPLAGDFLRLYAAFTGGAVGLVQNGVDPAKLEESVVDALPLMQDALAKISPILTDLAKKMPAHELRDLTQNYLLRSASVNGKPLFGDKGIYDSVMRHKLVDTWRLIIFAVKENYPDFFSVLGASREQPKAAPPSETSST